MSVFKMDGKFEVVLNPDAVKLVPELASLNQEQIRYIILSVDYCDSPLRRLPYLERRKRAARMVYKSSSLKIETSKVKKAMIGYKSLVFDIRRETIDTYKEKIRQLHKESLRDDLTYKQATDNHKLIEFYQERVDDLDKQITTEETEEIQLEGKKKLSLIEVWQRRQEAFKQFNS